MTVESVRLIDDKDAFAKHYDPEQMTLRELLQIFCIFETNKRKNNLDFVEPVMLEMVKWCQNFDILITFDRVHLILIVLLLLLLLQFNLICSFKWQQDIILKRPRVIVF